MGGLSLPPTSPQKIGGKKQRRDTNKKGYSSQTPPPPRPPPKFQNCSTHLCIYDLRMPLILRFFASPPGSRQVLHTGSSWGYGALVTLRPDDELAIHVSISGLDDGYIGRRLIHMYIMDTLLSYEPWINITTACTFPEPWGPPPRAKMYPGFFSDVFKRRRVTPDLPLSEYAGRFGNFGYGNITVVHNSTDETLDMFYGELGWWHLYCKRGDDFAAEGLGDVWPRELRSVHFRSSKGSQDSIDEVVVSFESRLPPVFKRNLKMSEAPPPPDPSDCAPPTVPLPAAGCHHIYSGWTVLFLLAIIRTISLCREH